MSDLDPANRRLMVQRLAGMPLFWVAWALGRFQHHQPWDGWASIILGCLFFVGSWYKGGLKGLISRRALIILVPVTFAAATAILWAPLVQERLLGYAVLCAPMLAAIVRRALRPATPA
jgi:hypothetical protein